MEKLLRKFFLFLSKNKVLNKLAKRWGLKFGASQVVAGLTIDSAIKTVKSLNEKGFVCTVDHLGEFVFNREEAIESTEYCKRTLEAIEEESVNCNLSLKLTQIGLDIDENLCLNNMKEILDVARKYRNFVRIDMEDYSHCEASLKIFKRLHKEYGNHIGIAIQGYLHRAKGDVKDLKGVNLRLIKGAYKENANVAYQDKRDVDNNYIEIIKQHLINGSYTAIATHDHNVIYEIMKFCKENSIPKEQFEFQMLYGFRTELQNNIVKNYKMRIYVPYGNDWYGYFMRRLAERPQNVSFAIRGLLFKK